MLNPVTFGLCVAAVPVILLYPGAKRVFPVPQLVLALAWGFAVLISWTAVTGQDPDIPLWSGSTWRWWGKIWGCTQSISSVWGLAMGYGVGRSGSCMMSIMALVCMARSFGSM